MFSGCRFLFFVLGGGEGGVQGYRVQDFRVSGFQGLDCSLLLPAVFSLAEPFPDFFLLAKKGGSVQAENSENG